MRTIWHVLAGFCFGGAGILMAEGDWPEPRQNAHLTAFQPLPGAMTKPPRELARMDLDRSRPAITPIARQDRPSDRGICCVSGALCCYDTTGELLWRSHPEGLNFSSVIAAEDLNHDGQEEILLTTNRPGAPYPAAVLLSAADGRLLWRYDVDPMSYAWYLYADHYWPGTDTKQIVVVMQGYPPEKDNGYIALFDWPPCTDAPRQKWRYDFDRYTCFPSLLQTDLDGDQIKELVIETHSRMWFLDVLTGRVKHFVEWDVGPANIRSYGLIRFVDLDGDGREDFLCIANFAQHHEVLLNRGGRMEKAWHHGWPESVTTCKVATTWPEPPYADLDGDGRLEIVVSMFYSEAEENWLIRAYDALTGELKYLFPGAVAVRCGDVDGDGRAEILADMTTDPARKTLQGACLLKVKEGKLQPIWRDREATAIAENGGDPQVRRDGRSFQVNLTDQGVALAQPAPRPVSPSGSDFSKVPAMVGAAPSALLAADLTGDGINELIVYQGSVRVFKLVGNTLEPCGQYASSSVPMPVDLDGDGKLELVLTTVSSTDLPIVEAITPALNNKVLWRCRFPPIDRPGLSVSQKAYVRTIHLTGKATPDLYVWAGAPIFRSAGLEGRTGAILWEKGEMPGIERYWGPTVNFASAYDLNGDGKEELVFTNPDYYCMADGTSGDMLLGPIQPTAIFKQPSQGLYTCPVILDQKDKLPTVCLVNGHYFQAAMSLKADPYWYKLPPVGEAPTGREGFLRLTDGTWLMGFGRQNGNFACVNVADGSVRWEINLQAAASDIVSGNIDGDGISEFVFGTSHGRLWVIGDNGTKARVVWSMDLAFGIDSPILADMDGDGRVEIVCHTADGYVHILGAQNEKTAE